MSLHNKQILVGVTGGIAAYKAADLVRRLQDAGADVRVAMTAAACEFITPLTLQALSGYPVHLDLLDPEAEAGMGHIELARWADLILVAPATANFVADMVQGKGNNLLLATCLAATGKIAVAPAMNQAMWAKAATQDNINTLVQRGTTIIGPAAGLQACGDVGLGRMEEVVDIVSRASSLFESSILGGKHVVITAGPTREAIDPVRYISNHSSGKMGFSLAQAAVAAGAKVTLISGPVNLATPDKVTRVDVVSAQQMLDASLDAVVDCDIFIACAAVSDYKPEQCANNKIKKSSESMALQLVRNPDIVSTVASLDNKPLVVGFAAETQDVANYAEGKRKNKKLDAIIANDVSRTDIGFNSDENEVLWISEDEVEVLPRMSKTVLADALVKKIAGLLPDVGANG